MELKMEFLPVMEQEMEGQGRQVAELEAKAQEVVEEMVELGGMETKMEMEGVEVMAEKVLVVP